MYTETAARERSEIIERTKEGIHHFADGVPVLHDVSKVYYANRDFQFCKTP